MKYGFRFLGFSSLLANHSLFFTYFISTYLFLSILLSSPISIPRLLATILVLISYPPRNIETTCKSSLSLDYLVHPCQAERCLHWRTLPALGRSASHHLDNTLYLATRAEVSYIFAPHRGNHRISHLASQTRACSLTVNAIAVPASCIKYPRFQQNPSLRRSTPIPTI
jgi:hypothetical protein